MEMSIKLKQLLSEQARQARERIARQYLHEAMPVGGQCRQSPG